MKSQSVKMVTNSLIWLKVNTYICNSGSDAQDQYHAAQSQGHCCFTNANNDIESQNFRGWKGPLKIHQSNPPAKAGSLEQVTQKSIQVSFKCLQRRRLHHLSKQPVPLLCKPPSKVFPHVHMELPVLQFVSVMAKDSKVLTDSTGTCLSEQLMPLLLDNEERRHAYSQGQFEFVSLFTQWKKSIKIKLFCKSVGIFKW